MTEDHDIIVHFGRVGGEKLVITSVVCHSNIVLVVSVLFYFVILLFLCFEGRVE